MYRRTAKSKAMAAAHYVLEVVNAPIITNSLAQGCVWSATELTQWLQERDSTPDMPGAIEIALERLELVEERAWSVQSNPIDSEILSTLHFAIKDLRRAAKAIERNAVSKHDYSDEDEEEGMKLSDPGSSTSDFFDVAGKLEAPPMFEDLQRARMLVSLHRGILMIILLVLGALGCGGIVWVSLGHHSSDVAALQKNVTMELAYASSVALNTLYDYLREHNRSDISVATASSVLSEMTAATSGEDGSQELHVSRDNYMVEYRAAVQNFWRSGAVDAVTTPRVFSGLCMKRESHNYKSYNDIFVDQKVVFDNLSPYQCANDAAFEGIFHGVTPGFIKYTEKAETYRRTSAHVASYYHRGFEFSVAVTRDKSTIQDVLIPKNSLFNKQESSATQRTRWVELLTLYVAITCTFLLVVEFTLITWMLSSQARFRFIIFPALIGIAMMVCLIMVLILSDFSLTTARDEAIKLTTASLLKGIGAASLTSKMVEYELSAPFLRLMCTDLFPGRLAIVDKDATNVFPSAMGPVLEAVNGYTMASFQRGQFSDVVGKYAVSVSYLQSLGIHLFVIQKLEFSIPQGLLFLIAVSWGVLAAVISFFYVQHSPLGRLHKHEVGSGLLLTKLEGSTVRWLFYCIVLVFLSCGVLGLTYFAAGNVHDQRIQLSTDTLGILSAAIRAPSIVDMCTSACGMPDFISILYLQREDDEGSETPKISILNREFPILFHSAYIDEYIGTQIAMGDLHTTLVNAPSFSTPLVNRSWNGINPKYIVRNMVTGSNINDTVGFAIERFPRSYNAETFRILSMTGGLAGALVFFCIIVTICEYQYLKLHERFRKKQSLKKPIIIMACAVSLPLFGFSIYGFVLVPLIRAEVLSFSRDEIHFVLHAVAERLGLLCLQNENLSSEEVLKLLVVSAEDINVNIMKLAQRYFRILIAEESPERGSGTVLIHGVKEKLVTIGPLDRGTESICDFASPENFIDDDVGELLYCYEEVPQVAEDPLNSPRFFAIGVLTRDTWINDQVDDMWPIGMSFSIVIGALITWILLIILFLTLHAAHANGFPLIRKGSGTSLREPIPETFKLEFFVPRLERKIWVCSLLLPLGIITAFIVVATRFSEGFLNTHSVALSYRTEIENLEALVRYVERHSYDYIIFPFIDLTVGDFPKVSEDAENGALEYNFLTEQGLAGFQEGMSVIYRNFSESGNVAGDLYSSARYGYENFVSLIGAAYEAEYISQQEDVMLKMIDELMQMVISKGADISRNHESSQMINFLYSASLLKDLVKKLLILDHMALNSYASRTFVPGGPWPFAVRNEEKIVVQLLKARDDLSKQISSALLSIKTILASMEETSKGPFTYLIETIGLSIGGSIVLSHPSDEIWNFQNARNRQITAQQNSSSAQIARAQQEENLACLINEGRTFTEAKNSEASFRKTQQLIDSIDNNIPLETQLQWISWERVSTNNRMFRRSVILMVSVMVCYVSTSVCILLHVGLMRRRYILSEKNYCDVPIEEEPQQNDGQEESLVSSKLNSLDSVRKEKLQNDVEEVIIEASLKSVEETLPAREHAPVILLVGLCLALTLIPIICGYFLLEQFYYTTKEAQEDISKVLALYPKLSNIENHVAMLLGELSKFYAGLRTADQLLDFLALAEVRVNQLCAVYLWERNEVSSVYVLQLEEDIANVHEIVLEEVVLYQNIVPPQNLPLYADSQSLFSRTILAELTGENTYGTLLPVSLTTDGSAVKKFAEEYYATSLVAADQASSIEEELSLFQSFEWVLRELDQISSAELHMWHAVVTGCDGNNADRAVKYSDFTRLVGDAAFPSVSAVTLPSPDDALKEVQDYFEVLLKVAGTPEEVEALFTNTETPPTPSSPLVSVDAYLNAAYISSIFYHVTTQNEFLSDFAFNRDLIPYSATREGKPRLVDAIQQLEDDLIELFFSISTGDDAQLAIEPATLNEWVWHTQVALIPHSDTRRLRSPNYLRLALSWVSVTCFIGLSLAVVAGYYTLFHF